MFFLPADLRIADDDREAVVEFLKHHYAAGRLSEAEMSARVDAAYAARYESQLDRLTWDLPELLPQRGPAPRTLTGRLAPAAAVAGVAVAAVGIASLVPPELWTSLIALGVPMLLMVLFSFAPVALPVIALLWFVRALTQPPRRGELPRGRPPGLRRW